MSLESEKYFCGIPPENEDIDFWSQHFNEFVYRLVCEGKIPQEYADKFFISQKGFQTQKISSNDGFKEDDMPFFLMH